MFEDFLVYAGIALGGLVALKATLATIVKLTPTPKDDAWFKKLYNVVDKLNELMKVRAPRKNKSGPAVVLILCLGLIPACGTTDMATVDLVSVDIQQVDEVVADISDTFESVATLLIKAKDAGLISVEDQKEIYRIAVAINDEINLYVLARESGGDSVPRTAAIRLRSLLNDYLAFQTKYSATE